MIKPSSSQDEASQSRPSSAPLPTPNLDSILKKYGSRLLTTSYEFPNKHYTDKCFREAKASIEAMVLDIIENYHFEGHTHLRTELRQRLSERLDASS